MGPPGSDARAPEHAATRAREVIKDFIKYLFDRES
jgi:hypothetical protein